jgi:hypothetical protein
MAIIEEHNAGSVFRNRSMAQPALDHLEATRIPQHDRLIQHVLQGHCCSGVRADAATKARDTIEQGQLVCFRSVVFSEELISSADQRHSIVVVVRDVCDQGAV